MKTIEAMAREAGFEVVPEGICDPSSWDDRPLDDLLARFYALARAEERERCAKVCEAGKHDAKDWDSSYWDQACDSLAFRIRAAKEPAAPSPEA